MQAALAENPRAVIGGNFPPLEEAPKKKSPKLTPEQELEYANKAKKAARALASLFRIARSRIMGKREGDEPMIIRFILSHWLHGIGCPVKLTARIIEVDRGQPGEDEETIQAWSVRNPKLERAMECFEKFLDSVIDTDPEGWVEWCLAELRRDREDKAKAKKEKAEAKAAEAAKPKPEPKPLTEADRLVAAGQAKRLEAKKDQVRRILHAVIAKGEAPGASKEARSDAKKARLALVEIDAPRKRKA